MVQHVCQHPKRHLPGVGVDAILARQPDHECEEKEVGRHSHPVHHHQIRRHIICSNAHHLHLVLQRLDEPAGARPLLPRQLEVSRQRHLRRLLRREHVVREGPRKLVRQFPAAVVEIKEALKQRRLEPEQRGAEESRRRAREQGLPRPFQQRHGPVSGALREDDLGGHVRPGEGGVHGAQEGVLETVQMLARVQLCADELLGDVGKCFVVVWRVLGIPLVLQ